MCRFGACADNGQHRRGIDGGDGEAVILAADDIDQGDGGFLGTSHRSFNGLERDILCPEGGSSLGCDCGCGCGCGCGCRSGEAQPFRRSFGVVDLHLYAVDRGGFYGGGTVFFYPDGQVVGSRAVGRAGCIGVVGANGGVVGLHGGIHDVDGDTGLQFVLLFVTEHDGALVAVDGQVAVIESQ